MLEGILGGPLVAVFTMGIVFPFANQKGAICGSVAGVAFGWVIFGFSKADPKSSILKSYIPPHVDFAQCNGNWTSKFYSILLSNFIDPQMSIEMVSRPLALKIIRRRHRPLPGSERRTHVRFG